MRGGILYPGLAATYPRHKHRSSVGVRTLPKESTKETIKKARKPTRATARRAGARRSRRHPVPNGAQSLARRRVPLRLREAFSPENPLPRGVEYIPYRHAVSQAKRRLRHTPLAYLGLSIAWIAVGTSELVTGSPENPVVLAATIVSFVAFAGWNTYTLARMRHGHPSGSVWRYGLFLWHDSLVVLPASGPVIIVPIEAIESVTVGRESEPSPAGTSTSRVVRITALGNGGERVSVTIDDLGAMPAPHLVRTLDTWRTGVEPELLAAAPTAGSAAPRRQR